jgi:hypothetical protein
MEIVIERYITNASDEYPARQKEHLENDKKGSIGNDPI